MENRKNKKLLTLQDLEQFYSTRKKSFHFSASEDAEAIVVQVPGTITFSEDDYDPTLGLLPVHLQSCHIEDNRNKSSISEDSMTQAIPSIYNRPILGYIHKLSDGSYDFAGHEMFINDDGDVEYEEIAVGTIPESCNAQLVYDEEKEKTYLEVDGFVYEEYTRAADILRTKKQSKVSVELSLLDFSYDAKSRHLNIDKFYFSGVTILGVTRDGNETPIEEGMYGSNIKLKDFSVENNSLFSNETEEMKEKLIEMQESINTLLSRFNINEDSNESKEIYGKEEQESMNDEIKVEEEVTEVETVEENVEEVSDVVETEEVVVEDTTEESAEETVEEVTVTEEFTEEVAETETDEAVEEVTPDVGEDANEDGEVDVVEEEIEKTETVTVVEEVTVKPEKYSVTMSDGSIKEFALSLDEINNALYMLVNQTYGEADNTYYGVQVFEDGTLIMIDWWNNKAFRQSYTRGEDDNFSLVGDRVAVNQVWVTAEEEEALNEMKANYSSLVQFKADTENAELHAQREAILYDAKYSVLAEKDENNEYKNEAYAKLVSEMDNYSLTDLEKELKSVFADHITNGGQFAYAGEIEKPTVTKKLFANSKTKKSSRYGNLFDK